MTRPRIGLTTYYKRASWGVWDATAAIVPGAYVEAVAATGATPLLLPPVGADPDVLDVLDGLVVIGGADLDPASYGAAAHPKSAPEPGRDEAEIELVLGALARELPLLAICRGAQVLNVALGGTLHQHLPDLLGHERYQPAPGVFGEVGFATTDDSRIRAALGVTAVASCYHHQAIDRVADGLVVTARSGDEVIQAVETAGDGWALGVQFHPEDRHDTDLRLFDALTGQARAYLARSDRTQPHRPGVTPDPSDSPSVRDPLEALPR